MLKCHAGKLMIGPCLFYARSPFNKDKDTQSDYHTKDAFNGYY